MLYNLANNEIDVQLALIVSPFIYLNLFISIEVQYTVHCLMFAKARTIAYLISSVSFKYLIYTFNLLAVFVHMIWCEQKANKFKLWHIG